ncbi:MAG: hypothetical protein RIT26_1463 [Pseudomonadota bacterium]
MPAAIGATLHPGPARVFMLGATGTIGQATLRTLLAQGHEVVSFQRPGGRPDEPEAHPLLTRRTGNVEDADSVWRDGFRGERFDAVISCLASRTGLPADAWAIDHQAHLNVLQHCAAAGVRQFVLLSALCVQKPRLAFQHAKLAFEQALVDSGLSHSIVRPTAFFKSLSGQVGRVRNGRPFMVLGDGRLTACKPISDADLADFLVGCLGHPQRQNRILPIGGPGPAISPAMQADLLAQALGRPVRLRHVPAGMLRGIARTLGVLGRWSASWQAKAELAQIGLYYATESMLVWDPVSGRYDADATPEWGQETLLSHYQKLIATGAGANLREHAVF